MNNKIILVVLMVTVLVGCTSDFKVDENLVEDFSNKFTSTVINKIGKEKAEKNETHSIDTTNINKIKIDSSVGNIIINAQDIGKASIDISITAYSKNKEFAEKLIKDYTYEIESKWNSIIINTTQSEEFRELKDALKDNELLVDLTINIPKSINDISITNNVGDINIENMEGKILVKSNVADLSVSNSKASCSLKSDVGNINLRNCSLVGKSELNINTGDITILSTDISQANNIVAEVAVGDISITLPENSSYNADINEFMEEKRNVVNGDGKTKIKLVANVGDIILE